ncbi:hypothetical protein OS493_018404 [Desmophyllum pertusum]|uniref:Peptidase M24 domain-containing protein n=1 Tax=Desmophyllum pertusum TaxID=174260 RepID=A0A9X0D9D6_9CNID|nr:hypothetical protein OS493_018404 [Desmophyllum pertusum]
MSQYRHMVDEAIRHSNTYPNSPIEEFRFIVHVISFHTLVYRSITPFPGILRPNLDLPFFFLTNSNYSALERTLFYDHVPSDRHMELWEINNKVHRKGLELVKPGMRCSDVSRKLNEIYMEHDILQYRVIGYGHSTGVLSYYYGRDWGLEFLEHVDTVLEPGMVITMETHDCGSRRTSGAGGYREHDTLIITETGVENTTASFPIGPEQNIIKN